MDNREPDIISRQTSVIALLCAIVLVLGVCLFFLGYCEPRHEKLNATPAASPSEQGASSEQASSGVTRASADTPKKDTSAVK